MQFSVIETEKIAQVFNDIEAIRKHLQISETKHLSLTIWLTTVEAAKALNVSTRTLQSYRDQAMIPFSQFGREIRYRAEDIQDFLMAHYVKSNGQKGGKL